MIRNRLAESTTRTVLHVILWISLFGFTSASWEEWWTYSGISGPDFWGLLNPEWHLCSRGRAQSPIDLDPDHLLFNPYLRPFHLESLKTSATVINSGHDVVVHLSESAPVNLTGGPLQYSYVIFQLHIHHGDDSSRGSEHTIGREAYPAEIQMLGYNSDLYRNHTEAMESRDSGGLVGLSVMLQVGNVSHPEFRALSSQLNKIIYRDQKAFVERIDVSRLLPSTDEYMTYYGSLTQPGCNEGVQWIVMNRALQISRLQISLLRKLFQGDAFNPKASLSNNFRPLQPLNNRVVHTNIDFRRRNEVSKPVFAHFEPSESLSLSRPSLTEYFPGRKMSIYAEFYTLQKLFTPSEHGELTINQAL